MGRETGPVEKVDGAAASCRRSPVRLPQRGGARPGVHRRHRRRQDRRPVDSQLHAAGLRHHRRRALRRHRRRAPSRPTAAPPSSVAANRRVTVIDPRLGDVGADEPFGPVTRAYPRSPLLPRSPSDRPDPGRGPRYVPIYGLTLWSRACDAFGLRRIGAQLKTEITTLRANLPTVRIVLVQRFALTVRLAPCPRPWGAMELSRDEEKGVPSWVLH